LQIESEAAKRKGAEQKGNEQTHLEAAQHNALVGYTKIDLFKEMKL
jgi:hypothetical protein